MTIRFHPLVVIAIITGICFLIFMLIRGCNNSKAALADNSHLSAIIAELKQDSIDAAYNAREYENRLELQEGQIALWQNQFFAKEDSLKSANDRINYLVANHHPIKPNADTSVTLVPNEYIQDCEGCFSELDNGRKLVFRYKLTADSLRGAYESMNSFDSLRIRELQRQNNDLSRTLHDAIDAYKKDEEKNKPHGTLYVSWGVLWNPFPSAAGMGLMYQNKYRVGYAFRWYYGRYGHMAETEINLPLSLKKR